MKYKKLTALEQAAFTTMICNGWWCNPELFKGRKNEKRKEAAMERAELKISQLFVKRRKKRTSY